MRHERTFVYQKSLALMQTAQLAIKQFPQGFSFLADQLRRNTSSVHHNFAEGYYQGSRRQQRRFFGYAIQSAREASASFDTAAAFDAADEQLVARGKGLALEVVRMLSKFSTAQGHQDSEPVIRPVRTQDCRTQAANEQGHAFPLRDGH
jgi:four helix bundle protein